jgi:predicted ABC-type ATPase
MSYPTDLRTGDFTPEALEQLRRVDPDLVIVDDPRRVALGPGWGRPSIESLAAAFDPSKHPRNPATGRDDKESPSDGSKFQSKKGGGTKTDPEADPGPEAEHALRDKAADEVLGDAFDTQTKYEGPVRTGEHGYTQERVDEVHDPYVEDVVSKGVPGQENPETLFLAGGSGSGKTTILNTVLGPEMKPEGAVMVNPDHAKEVGVPEYRQMVEKGSTYSAAGTHEESSDMSKAVLGEAVAGNYHAVVDGTGDSGAKKFMAKIDAQKALGRKVKVVMADIPTDEAVKRADLRARDPKSESYGRFVDEAEIRRIHKNVAANHLVWRDQVDDWEVYANDGTPELVARRVGGGKIEIIDKARYQQALDKAGE